MNAAGIYLATCRYVMAADFSDRQTWADLYRYLPYLRQSLSCFVCRNLVLKPLAPAHKHCFHFVCEKCKGGRMRLKPQCSWCKNYNDFEENTHLRVLVQCFQKLCNYIHNSPIGSDLRSVTTNGETNNLITIIQEGLEFRDNFQISSVSLPPPFGPAYQTFSSVHAKAGEPSTSAASGVNQPSVQSLNSSDQRHDLSESSEDEDYHEYHRESETDVTQTSSQETSPAPSEEIIDVCKTPSPVDKEKHHKKKRSVLSFDKAKDASSLEQKVLSFNCTEQKKSVNSVASPVVELAVKRAKVVLTNTKQSSTKVCKCGRGGTNSRLTCLGQRCPCYIKKLPCIGCKCTGCRNPRKPTDQAPGSGALNHDTLGQNDMYKVKGIV